MGTKFETIEARITPNVSVAFYKDWSIRTGTSIDASRDIKLLQSANLEELVSSCLLVIKGDRPKQNVHLFREFSISIYRWFSEAIRVCKAQNRRY
ncbi:hypothetical protein AHAS_Ahas14G0176000 [Arachis hypogaea]